MSRPLDGEKAQSIIRAAISVFGTQGFSATTIKHIAEKAQVAAGTVYTYFDDKEQLFAAAVEAVWGEFHGNMEVIFAKADTLYGKMESLVAYAMPLLKDLHPLVRGMFSQAMRMDLVDHNVNKLADRFYQLFRENGQMVHAEAALGDAARDIFRIWLSGFLFILASIDGDGVDAEINRLTNFVRFMLGGIKGTPEILPENTTDCLLGDTKL